MTDFETGVLFGCGICIGFCVRQIIAIIVQARLRSLIPNASLLSRAAEYAGLVAGNKTPGFGSSGEDSIALRDLATRIRHNRKGNNE